jgi:hypothetical protein
MRLSHARINRRRLALFSIALFLVLVVAFWVWPSLRCKVLGGTNNCTCGECCNTGPIQGRTVRDIYSCVKLPSGNCQEQWNDVEFACSGGSCSYSWDQGKCNTSANGCMPLLSNPQTVYCCSDDPPDPTDEPPTSTPTPTPTPTPLPPPNISLVTGYSALVYYAPVVGQPAQTIMGVITGGVAPFTVSVQVKKPSGAIVVYSFNPGSTFTLDATQAGNPSFGTDEEGIWQAWALLVDAAGQTTVSPVISWQVNWYPVHGGP